MKYSKKEIMVIFPREVQNQVQGWKDLFLIKWIILFTVQWELPQVQTLTIVTIKYERILD